MQGVADLVDRHGLFVVELALVVEGARLQKQDTFRALAKKNCCCSKCRPDEVNTAACSAGSKSLIQPSMSAFKRSRSEGETNPFRWVTPRSASILV